MANSNSNYPANALNNIEPAFVGDTIYNLQQLSSKGKPQSVNELQTRIDDYFKFCSDNDFRCGIESLSLALGVSRITFWNWTNGKGCDTEWKEKCVIAKQYILAFIEQASMRGKINPATSCFLMKNWANYRDSVTIEEIRAEQNADREERLLKLEELPNLSIDRAKGE